MNKDERAEDFSYTNIRFADIEMLRYYLDGFDTLTLQQKEFIYYLSEATLWGRDITFDQFGAYNLRIRKTLEAVYLSPSTNKNDSNFPALTEYLRRVWFSNGIYHHYGGEKFIPEFSQQYLHDAIVETKKYCDNHNQEIFLPIHSGETVEDLCNEIFPIIFDKKILPCRTNKTEGEDLVATSACNFYDSCVTQHEVENYYRAKSNDNNTSSDIKGLNTRITKDAKGNIIEQVWSAQGLYGSAIKHIIACLKKAVDVAENDSQREVINTLIDFYHSGDLSKFDDYSIKWVHCTQGHVDFINGFIEVYADPLGIKGSWEGIVEYIDLEASRRTEIISQNAQWFEDRSPIDPRFRKKKVKGVSAKAVCAAMLGGDEYPSTAIGINLPNSDKIRKEYGSKSVTISNIIEAYDKASSSNKMRDEFVLQKEIKDLLDKYANVCDRLHTDLHECLGHGSGQLLFDTEPDALKAYASTIEEARADLFALYYIADKKMLELNLLDDANAYKAEYFSYILNGLLTQLVRITPGHNIEEAHMRNRALIAHWCLDNGSTVMLEKYNGKTQLVIKDYQELRYLFAKLLAEVQRIKSEGDFFAAKNLVEKYAVKVNSQLHAEVLERYHKLNIAPYKGFINPILQPIYNKQGKIIDIIPDYSESYDDQMLRYSREYATLI